MIYRLLKKLAKHLPGNAYYFLSNAWTLKAIAQYSRQLQLVQACMYSAGSTQGNMYGHADCYS